MIATTEVEEVSVTEEEVVIAIEAPIDETEIREITTTEGVMTGEGETATTGIKAIAAGGTETPLEMAIEMAIETIKTVITGVAEVGALLA